MNDKKENPSLVKIIQLAREHAYLGMYREASGKFQQGISMIQATMPQYQKDKTVHSELISLMNELIQESKSCSDLDCIVSKGMVPVSAAPVVGGTHLQGVQRQQPVEKKLPFGQEPFTFHRNPAVPGQAKHYTYQQNGYQPQVTHNYHGQQYQQQPVQGHHQPSNVQWMGANKAPHQPSVQRHNSRQEKDPGVWSPAPKKKYKKKSTGGARGVKRDYEKPWQKGGNEKKKGEKGKKGDPEDSAFLLDRYPKGDGPDANLIRMLEKEIVDRNPNVKFEDIASLDTAKQILKETVLLPLMMPSYFQGIRQPRKGVLLFGPPGTGKTLLAKAVATFGKTTFFNVHPSALASKWKGETEKLVRILFEMARFYAPTTIFFDEIDSIASNRDGRDGDAGRKLKSEMLMQIDGATTQHEEDDKPKNVIILGATNLPWDLDPAIIRRLDKRIHIPLPDKNARRELLRIMLKNEAVDENIDWDYVVEQTKLFSGDDMKNLCRDASMAPLRRWMMTSGAGLDLDDIKKKEQEFKNTPISDQDFKEALQCVKASNSTEKLGKYREWMELYGSK